jgi:hypothetical protein
MWWNLRQAKPIAWKPTPRSLVTWTHTQTHTHTHTHIHKIHSHTYAHAYSRAQWFIHHLPQTNTLTHSHPHTWFYTHIILCLTHSAHAQKIHTLPPPSISLSLYLSLSLSHTHTHTHTPAAVAPPPGPAAVAFPPDCSSTREGPPTPAQPTHSLLIYLDRGSGQRIHSPTKCKVGWGCRLRAARTQERAAYWTSRPLRLGAATGGGRNNNAGT